MKKILVVGAGFSGAVVARQLAEAGYLVDVIDKRSHIAGNAYDFVNEHGIRIHKYGPHLYHTNNEKIHIWLSRFTEWVPYKHKVKAILDNGSYVTLPVNKSTKEIVGKDNIIDVFFRPYTKKMWGLDIEELDPNIINRIPIRDDDNEYYFPDDKFQFLPKLGYTSLINNILNHEKILVHLETEYNKDLEKDYYHVFNSMPIDEYYNFKYGKLPYRSIKFHNVNMPIPKLLPTVTVNFTNNSKFTRITEWKNLPLHGENNCFTSLTYEEPCCYSDNNNERFYPVKDLKGLNKKNYTKYKQINNNKVTFIGRCGLYVYIDMHQAVSTALSISSNFLRNE